MSKRIGFIGVGLMGHGMAKNLRAKGYPLTIMGHRNRAPVESLVAQGAHEATTARAVAEAGDIVFICVTGSPQVEAIVYGDEDGSAEEGLLAGARDGLIVIDCSTSQPSSTMKIAVDFAARGARFVDAPLTRTPVEAEAGRLNCMVGADDDTFAEIRPVLEAFCENIFRAGDLGAGHKMKLINNFIVMGQAALVTEAVVACAATGVDPQKLYELLSAGGTNSGILQMIMPKAIQGDYTGMKFGLANARKDLRYYRHMVEEANLVGAVSDTLHQLFVEAGHFGFDDRFVASLIEAQAIANGLVLTKPR